MNPRLGRSRSAVTNSVMPMRSAASAPARMPRPSTAEMHCQRRERDRRGGELQQEDRRGDAVAEAAEQHGGLHVEHLVQALHVEAQGALAIGALSSASPARLQSRRSVVALSAITLFCVPLAGRVFAMRMLSSVKCRSRSSDCVRIGSASVCRA